MAESLDVVHVHLIEHLWVLTVLWLEIEVDLEALHVLLQLLLLLPLFLLCFLLFFLFLLVDLQGFELVKHILVMQNCMGELLLEIVLVQQAGNTFLDEGNFQNLVDAGSLVGLRSQHQPEEVHDVVAEVLRGSYVLPLDDFLGQLMQTLRVEGWHQGAHLVQQHSKRPDVRFEGVRLRLDDLRRQIVRSAHDSLCLRLGLAQHSGDAEVSQFDHALLRQENVLRLKITVQYLSVVDVLQGQADLCEPVEHVVFAPVFKLAAVLFARSVLFFDPALEVATVGEVHDDAEFALFGFVDFFEPNNVGMVEHLQNLGLPESFLSLVLGHARNVDLLDDGEGLVALALNEVGRAETADAESLYLLVSLV